MSIELLLTEETNLVLQFIECLIQEQEILSQEQVHDLQPVTDRKNVLIAELMSVAERRNALLRQAGLPDTSEGLKAWVALYASATSQKTFDELKALAAQAKQLNEINANLVNARLQATQQALAILLPQEQSPSLYNLRGQSSLRGNFKLIDSA